MTRKGLVPLSILLLALTACKDKPRQLSEAQILEIRELRADASFGVAIRDYDRAETSIRKALDIDDSNPDLWVAMGAIQRRAGRSDAAAKNYKKALKCYESLYKATGKPVYLAQRGWVLGLLGDMSGAEKALKKAASLHPEDPEVRRLTSEDGIPRMFKTEKFREIALIKE